MTFDSRRDTIYAGFWWRALAGAIDFAAVIALAKFFRMLALPTDALLRR
jgi:hypothetical protein